MTRTTKRNERRGQALVEFALVVPVFLLVVLGLFDLGRAVFYYSTISNASREAVRLAIVDQNVADIQQEAVDSGSGLMPITTADVTVTFLAPDLSAGGPCSTVPYDIGCVVRVEIRHSFVPATPFVGAIDLSAETHQAIERRFASP